jgi:hypothetical protein
MANTARDRSLSKKEIVHANQQIRRGERVTELDLQREVTAILATAGWKVLLKEHRHPTKRFGGDILASRTELGRERRYAVECVLQLDGPKVHDYFSRFRNWVRQSKVPFEEFDEFWLVGQEYTDKPAPRNNPGNDRHFRALDLNELRALFFLPRRGRESKARTKIGKAVEANEKEIQLAVAGLILQIDAKIEALGDERPNSGEAITRRDADIVEYKRMRAELEQIQTTVAGFKKGTEKEATVVRSLKTFADGVGLWWNKAQDTILTKTFDMGLFTTAVGICSIAGAGGKMAVAVSAVLVGGKPVAQALKGLVSNRLMTN